MSLEQAIKHKKEERKPYYDSKRFDVSCRNHGSCPWCKMNRLHKKFQEEQHMKDLERE